MYKLIKQADGTYRLTSMDIRETSMVDRAANKRKFLLAKGDSMASQQAELMDDGNGGLTLDAEAVSTPPEVEGDLAKMELPPGKKTALVPIAEKLLESALALRNAVATATEAKAGAAVPDALANEVKALKVSVEELDKAIGAVAAAPGKDPEAAAEEAGKGVEKKALTEAERAALPDGDFGVPKKRAYPIPDEGHAKAALADVDKFGTEEEKKAVRSACKAKYPQMEVAEKVAAPTPTETPLRIPPRAVPDKDKKTKEEEKVGKAEAPTHQKLLGELHDAIVECANVIAKDAKTMEYTDLRAAVGKLEEMTWKLRPLVNVINVGKAVKELSEDDVAKLLKGEVPEAVTKIGRKMSSKNRVQFQAALTKIKEQMDVLFGLYTKMLPEAEQDAMKEVGKAHALMKRTHEVLGLPERSPEDAGAGTWPQNPADGMKDAGTTGKDGTAPTLDAVSKSDEEKERERIEKREQASVEPPSTAAPEGKPAPVQKDLDPGFPYDLNDPEYVKRAKETGRY